VSKRENETYSDLDSLSREELEEFIREKESIRQIVGQIGGKPSTMGKVMTVLMIVFIVATLVAAPFLPKSLELPAVEVGIVLLSLKIFFFLQNEAKVTHFQFWMLSSLEWRMNDMAKRLARIDKNVQKLSDVLEQSNVIE
jgi:uncharacterized membrane protein